MKTSAWILAAVMSGGLAGCGGGNGGTRATDEPTPKRAETSAQGRADAAEENAPGTQEFQTLYDRIGGEVGVRALVDDWIARALSDPRVNFERRGTDREWRATSQNVARLKEHFVQLISVTTGGPTQYSGRSMAEVHDDMEISNSEFDAIMDDLRTSLTEIGVERRDQRELMRKIELTRQQIVERRD